MIEPIRDSGIQFPEPSPQRSLFDEWNLQLVDLGGGPVLLTEVGQSIFGGHMRMQKAQQFASNLAYLARNRATQPLNDIVVVADFEDALVEARASEDYDALNNISWMAYQAVNRTIDYIDDDSETWHLDVPSYEVIDDSGSRSTVRQVELPEEDCYLITQVGSRNRVILSPSSIIPTDIELE